MPSMKIGVFDSGVGGQSVANAISKAMPEHEVIFKNDAVHIPYGTKTVQEIFNYSLPIIKSLQDDGCRVIVIACNTLSTNAINELRQELSVPLIAVEPMVKPAVNQTKTKVVAVCATPRTLSSKRYAELKQLYAVGVNVLEPDCSHWTELIESNSMDKQMLRSSIEDLINQQADVIVLGCTHYHWIEKDIKTIAGSRALVLQPEPAIITQLQRVISQLG